MLRMKKYSLALGILAVTLIATIALATTEQRNPGACVGQWTNCFGAVFDGGLFSYTSQNNRIGFWQNYGFSIPAGSTINSVTVRADFWASRTSGFIGVQVSNNSGASWGPTH